MDPLATAGELGLHLQRTDLDPGGAEQAVQLASGAVRAYCRWDITEVTETLHVEGSGTTVLTLPTMNLTQLIEVRLFGDPIDILDATGFSWSRKGQLFRVTGWPRFAPIAVDCVHGYNPVPDVIKLVTLELAARALQNPQGLKSVQVGQVSRTFAGAESPRLSELDQRLLERYAI